MNRIHTMKQHWQLPCMLLFSLHFLHFFFCFLHDLDFFFLDFFDLLRRFFFVQPDEPLQPDELLDFDFFIVIRVFFELDRLFWDSFIINVGIASGLARAIGAGSGNASATALGFGSATAFGWAKASGCGSGYSK